MKFPALLLLTSALACGAVERATFDSAGGLTSLIDQGDQLNLHGALYASFEGEVRAALQPHDQRTPITRVGLEKRWQGTITFPNTAQAHYSAAWEEQGHRLVLQASVSPESFLDLESLDYVIDLPRDVFVGGQINGTPLPARKPESVVVFQQNTDSLSVAAPDSRWTLTLKLDQPRDVSLTDHWDKDSRVFRLRIALRSGLLTKADTVPFRFTLGGAAKPSPAPAQVTIDTNAPRYSFDGFGGNYCFQTMTPVADYTLEQLQHAWSRLELKAQLWDRQREKPGAELVRDFELMQRVQKMSLPWAISIWRLPERFYVDANEKPFFTFGRQIAPERWPEVLELISSYLLYLKMHYAAEPDFFSFNEPDLGVNVGFSAVGQREMIKRIGRHLAEKGLKTKLLLGDAANPRDSHKYVLATAADAEAMKYVGALSFHSWGSGSPQQYRAWAQVADWLQLPLIVGEAGVDPGSWRNRSFDSYAYGLLEAKQYQELLRDAEPVSLLFWQYTEDYGLVRHTADGQLEPTGRFFFMKQFSNLTPLKSEVIASESDQPDVLVSAFRKNDALAVHVLNLGAERDLTLQGLTGSGWKSVTTTETSGYAERTLDAAPSRVRLPARSLTTWVKAAQ